MNPFQALKSLIKNMSVICQFLAEIREGIANHADLTNRKMNECIGLLNQFLHRQHNEHLPKKDTASPAEVVDQVIQETLAKEHHSYFWGDRMLTLDKSAGFLSNPSFCEAYNSIRGSHTYDQYTSPHTIAWRLHTLVWAAKSGISLEGDFVECGVFKGDMSWVISQMIDLHQSGKQFYLYDTFEGFSDKYSSPTDFPDSPNLLCEAHNHYRNPEIYPYVCKRFANNGHVKIIKGVVPDVLLVNAPPKIAFLHIDLNSPAAEIGALEILFPRLTKGAVLVLDDYGWKQFHKQKEAEDLFMNQRGYEILELPTGQGIVIKKS